MYTLIIVLSVYFGLPLLMIGLCKLLNCEEPDTDNTPNPHSEVVLEYR